MQIRALVMIALCYSTLEIITVAGITIIMKAEDKR